MGDEFCNNQKGSAVMDCPLANRQKAAAKPQKKDEVNAILKPAKLTVIVKKFFKDKDGTRKAYTTPKRQPIVLSTSRAFKGTGTFNADDKIRFFKSATKDDEIKIDGLHNIFKGNDLARGITLYAEGAKPSARMDDVKLTLQLAGDPAKTLNDATAT